jgi:nucleoside phosphorylase
MTNTVRIGDIRGRIDFAILAIREDEFEAVLRRFQPGTPVIDGEQLYFHSVLIRNDGSRVNVAVARAWDQGESIAQSVARDLLEDLRPRWLILTGIAGGVPDNEFTFGDVLLASNLIDFSITAAIENSRPQFRTSGATAHPDVTRLLAFLPAMRASLGPCNLEHSIGMPKPHLLVPDDLADSCYYGSPGTKQKTRDILKQHFPLGLAIRPPLFKIGTVASSNVLLKDTALLEEWKQVARQISHIEMEAAGVFHAARRNRPHETPLLCIRGLSDVVGFRRSAEWTQFACDVAASFLHALLSLSDDFFRLETDPPPNALSRFVRTLPERLTRVVRGVGYVISTVISICTRGAIPSCKKAPTVEAIIEAFKASSKPLLSRVVPSERRLPRKELEQLDEFLRSGESPVLCVLGGPGSGKTSLLALIAQNAIDLGVTTFAIKADFLPADVPFESWGIRELKLDISALDAVRVASTSGKVLIIVDQLDALASTVDLKSDRLDCILDFISRCSSLPKVQVVCSCRHFDFNYDVRFKSLDARVIDLQLPSWEDVAKLLETAGLVGAQHWSEKFREILRTPQHLRVFVDRFNQTGKSDAFGSYHLMLDDFWNRMSLSDAEDDFLYRITEQLIREESLWAPLVAFEKDKSVIRSLESKQLLALEGSRIGFKHQTLLEHAKARAFTKSERSFHEFVLERQSAILVRPTVWAVLQYLRDAHLEKYRGEIQSLFDSTLRLHLRYLLIEFLGQIQNPEEFEIAILSREIADPAARTRVLLAIRGRAKWFDAFQSVYFPSIMAGSVEPQWPMIGVITEAWDHARERCLELIERHWVTDSSKDSLTVRAIAEIGNWDERSVAVARTLARRVGRSDNRNYQIESLASAISASRPELAPIVVFDALPLPKRETLVGRRHHSALEENQGWYDLEEIALAAPEAFLRAGWIWLVSTCEQSYAGHESTVLYQYEGWCSGLDRDDERLPLPIVAAFFAAIDKCAEIAPDTYAEITRPSWQSENSVVHQFIIRGLRSAAKTNAAYGLEYLRGDRRRFRVGAYHENHQSDSIALVAAIAPELSAANRLELEEAIRSTSMYRDGIELIPDQYDWDREARLRLLAAIPNDLRSPKTREFMPEEMAKLPAWDQQGYRPKSGFVREIPPVSKQEILTSSNEEVLRTINASREINRSNTERVEVHGGWEMPGGPTTAAREIAELAKDDPKRAMELAKGLLSFGLEDAVSVAIQPFAESSLDDVLVLEFVRNLISQNPKSEELRSTLGYILYRRCRESTGLADDLCVVLREWLSQPWEPITISSTKDDVETTSGAPDKPESVLWAPRGGILDTDRSFWPLMAVTNGYLMRSPPAVLAWLDLVESQLSRGISENSLGSFLSELRWFRLDPKARHRGEEIVRKVFAQYPILQHQREGVSLVANVTDLLSAEFVEGFLNDLSISTSYASRQAYGELLALIALRESPHHWAADLLDRELVKSPVVTGDDAALVGIAFTAAQFWEEPEAKSAATHVLCKLISTATPRVSQAMGTVCYAKENFAADSETEQFLSTLANFPECLRHFPILDLAEHLVELLPHNRGLVLKVCKAIAQSGRTETGLFEAGPQLVNIAMTLQRFSDTRSEGLSLLEAFLQMGLDDAFSILSDIDIRPASRKPRSPMPRRKRRTRKT